jgi:ferredoxin--NADP+ reductase
VLIKQVEGGLVSPALRRLEPDDTLDVEGPFGSFRLPAEGRERARYLFVATGTGIAPFHCFVQSHAGLDYLLLHGTRGVRELYEPETFDRNRFIACIRREEGGDYRGRVTDYIREHPEASEGLCYLCGNSDMIYEVMAILRESGVPRERIFAEIYF